MSLPLSIIIATVAFILACWVTDIRTRRIPNGLSGSACLAGMLLNYSFFGGWGLANSLLGALLVSGVLLGRFALGGVGGGDVKMMGAIGALLGPVLALEGLALGLILGGLVMVAHLVGLGRLREKLESVVEMVRGALRTRSVAPLRISDRDAGAVTLPYSVPLGLGTVAVLSLAPIVGAV